MFVFGKSKSDQWQLLSHRWPVWSAFHEYGVTNYSRWQEKGLAAEWPGNRVMGEVIRAKLGGTGDVELKVFCPDWIPSALMQMT